MTDPDYRPMFVAMSAFFTGFSASELDNEFDPDDLPDTYLDFILTQDKAGLEGVLSAFAQAQADSAGDEARLAALVKQNILGDAALAAMAARITRLWYLGRWYEHEPPGSKDVGPYVSDTTYVRALAWNAMQTKAIGYSEYTDQYWTRPPVIPPPPSPPTIS